MYQPAPSEFARASERVRRRPPWGFRRWLAATVILVLAILAAGTAWWAYWINCGSCGEYIVCAQKCALPHHLDEQARQRMLEQQPKLMDRVQPQE